MKKAALQIGAHLVLAACTAFSAPITWNLSNATFNDGGAATGYFVFDPDAGTVSSWNIVASAGSILSAFTYTPANSQAGSQPDGGCPGPHISFVSNATFPNGLQPPYNLNENRDLCLAFASALTDTGGTVNLNLTTSDECLDCNPYRNFTQGSVQGATAGQGVLSVMPTTLMFQAQQSGAAQSQSIQIGGTAGTAWQATAATSSGGAWLSVSPESGQAPASLTAIVNPGSLTAGTYQGSITVQASTAAPSSTTVNVTLTVAAGEGQGGIITTIAGNGTSGYSGDGAPAALAELYSPAGVAVDGSGNVFVADGANHAVRKISAAGVITTVASFSGGTPSAPGEVVLEDVAVDASGNLFIADGINQVVRKLSSNGTITIVAGNGTQGYSGDGGLATAASLNWPEGLAADSNGNLFIADSYNNRVRKVSANGIITTVAGTGAEAFSGDGGPASLASLFLPGGLALDTSGNLFIADWGNNRVRKVSASGAITTVAGIGPTPTPCNTPGVCTLSPGCAGFSGDGGPATSASVCAPNSVAVDAAGDLFIADTGNSRIRQVSASGTITTVAGDGNIGFSGDGGPATSASLNQPVGVALDAIGNIFIGDTFNNRVREVTGAGSMAVPVISNLSPSSATAGESAFTLTVNGSGFVNGSTVDWNGSAVPTTYVSSGELTASIPASLIASAGTAAITVVASGAATSNVVTFTINPQSSSGAAPTELFVQQSKLVGSGAVNNPIGAFEGYSVALSGDGNTALIGGWQDFNYSGAAWVFTRSGGAWTQQGDKLGGGDGLDLSRKGWSVALSADGNTAAVGSPGTGFGEAGGAWIYTRSAGVWTQEGDELTGTGAVAESGDIPLLAFQGTAVALSADGNTLLVGGPNDNNSAGAAWVFTRSGGVWTQVGSKLVGTGAFGAASQGSSVAISGDGNTAVLGGPTDNNKSGAAWVFTLSGGAWTQQAKLVGTGGGGPSGQGTSVAVSSDGNTVILGGPGDSGNAGAVWVFTRSGNMWTQQGDKLVGSGAGGNASQGDSVGLSADGNTAIVGGPTNNFVSGPSGTTEFAGAAWVFARSGGSWAQVGSVLTGSGALGYASQGAAAALSGDGQTAIVGGPFDGGEFGSGAAWVFVASYSGAVPPPVISSLGQTSATAGGPAFTITVSGTGFTNSSTVEWNASAVPTTYVNSGQLTASIPASLIASAGTAAITVVTPGAGTSNAVTFTINPGPPVISGLSPSAVTAGGPAFTLTVNGSGFVSGSTVEWNGTAVTTSFVSATQLTASVSASLIITPSTVTVTVVNTGEGTSNAFIFAVGAAPGVQNGQLISHIADGGGWRSTLLLANTDTVPAPYTVSFWNDMGAAYLPALSAGVPTGTIPVGGSTIIETADTASALSEGWAQVTSSQSIGGTAIFRYDPSGQEAAVPLLTTGGTKLQIPYQVGNGLSLGVALANTNTTQTANITEVIRDQDGNQLSSRTLTLGPLNHTAFNPTIPSSATVGGVVEYDASVNIFGLGIRSAPEGSGLAFTSLDAVVPQAASTKTISHIADGGGWRSTIILVNTGTVPAPYTVSFWDDTGSPYVPPLASGSATGTIPVGGSTIIETADTASTLSEGWAQVSSSQSMGGTAIFRYDPWSQEAAVPLLTSGGEEQEIPYQVGSGLSLGIALANPSETQTANITEVIRDENGNQLSSRTLTLAPLNHAAFNPAIPSNSTGGGVVEYDSNVSIYALGIRAVAEGSGLAFTSVRAVYK